MKIYKQLIFGLAIAFVVYLIMTGVWSDVASVSEDVSQFSWNKFAVACLLAGGNYMIRYLRWEIYLKVVKIQIPRPDSLRIFFSSFLLTITPGKIGELIKSFLLKQSHNVPIARSAPIIIAERLTDMLALLIIAGFGVLFFQFGFRSLLVCACITIAGLIFLSSTRCHHFIMKQMRKRGILKNRINDLEEGYLKIQQMLHWKTVISCTALGIVAWFLECLALDQIIAGFESGVPNLLASSTIYSSTTIFGALSFLPGGLGVTEGSMVLFLERFGLVGTTSLAVTATCLVRLATLWFAVFLGLIAFLWHKRKYSSSEEIL